MRISLVVPVKNEAESIHELLDSLKAQTRLPDEVVIVDGGSVDGTVGLIERWVQERNLKDLIRVVRKPEATPGRGRNVGIAAAENDWIALTDAGIRLEPQWLHWMVDVVEDDPCVEMVCGSYEPVTESFWERCQSLAFVAPRVMRLGRMMRGPSVASLLIHRSVWRRVGGFPDLRAAEDRIFFRKLEEQGVRLGWAPEARCWWQLPKFPDQTFSKMLLYSKHNVWAGEQKNWHFGIARMYVVGLLLAVALLIYDPRLLPLVLIAPLARTVKSIWERKEDRSAIWALNPIRVLGVAAVLLLIDVATFLGWAQALITPNSRLRAEASRPFTEPE